MLEGNEGNYVKVHQARWYSSRDSNPLRPEERPEASLLDPSCSVSGACQEQSPQSALNVLQPGLDLTLMRVVYILTNALKLLAAPLTLPVY